MISSRRVAALAVLLLGPMAWAQPRLPAGPRVLFSVSDVVKQDDGTYGRLDQRLTYDPDRGEYVHETHAEGVLIARTVRTTSVAGPTPAEAEVSRALIATHPEIAPLLRRDRDEVTIDGGFPLVREAGHPCGPGGRCATFDVFTGRDRQRLRYVIVDLRTGRVLDADADPQRDSNLAHPAARRQSRLRL